MKGSLIRLINLAIFVPTLVLMTISGYFLYKNFMEYQNVKESTKYLKLAEKLEDMLIYLGQERGVSSIYSVSKGKYPDSAKLLKAKRALFSKSIEDMKYFINKNPDFYNIVQPILNITNRLPVVRKKIDSFKDNYIDKYFFSYYTVLENQILNTQAKIFKYFPEEIKKTYELKFPFEKIISYSGIVRGVGSYYITADLPMSEEIYKKVFLNYFHSTNILPINILPPQDQAIYKSKSFKKTERDIQTIVFYLQQANNEYYLTDNFNGYPIDSIDYFNLFTKRINYFRKTIDSLNNTINKELIAITDKATQNLIINALIFGLGVLIFVLGIYIQRLIKSHINNLSELLTSLAPITGETETIDVSSTEGINKAIKTVDRAIHITQESIKKSEEATKAKSLFLANMSHEIRTPLNGILGFLEVLKTTDLTPEQEDYVNTISQSAKNLLQIVNNILDVSKIESNKVTLEEIDFKAVDEFENTLELFMNSCAQKRIQYVADISPNIPTVLKGDVLKIKEILTNLITNAIKFTHPEGLISVKIKLQDIKDDKAKIYFEVKDSGIGMSEEQKEKIFEAFTQANESITRKYGGTGLGLTIVKSYLEMMGSEIHVESEINKGSKFYFTIEFPIVDPNPRYKRNLFKNITLAILNTYKDTLRKDYSIEYINYFGASKIGFNNAHELQKIRESEKINAIIVFVEESNPDEIEKLKELDLPIITISSFAQKDYVDKINPAIAVFDPNVPEKTYNYLRTIKEEKAVVSTKTKEKTVSEKPIYTLKALIAEDNQINSKLLQTTLKSFGIESDIANNGLEAFNKYTMNPEKYDVIFMDIQMPTMDGIEATQEILEFEKEEGIPHTPIIAVTANVLKGDRERFLGAGMDDYISKPIEKKELQRVLEMIQRHKYTQIDEIPQEKTEESETPEVIKVEGGEVKKESTTSNKILIATESSFLQQYFKNVLDFDFEIAGNINELTKKIEKGDISVLIIEEEFGDVDINNLIKVIKGEIPNIKIYIIGEEEYQNADGIISDLNPESIKEILKRLNNAE
ncbi:MAG: response regulator [Epsilonproteobacteria bacterium]|nr:response regulator [Campylobacterota bacterium]